MTSNFFDGHRPNLFGDKSGESFVNPHSDRADALRPQSKRCGKHKRRAIRLEQICGTHIRAKSAGNQRHDVRQRLSRLTCFPRKISDFFER
jgi:hypothetical protein